MLVIKDVPYASAPPGWASPVLDLYLPEETGEPPLSVVVPDAGADPRGSDYTGLAGDLASKGVAVAVVQWGVESPELAAVAGRPVDELVAQAAGTTGEVACALAVAAAKLGIRGATSSAHPLVVVGHGLGANAVAMATLTTPRPFEACFAAERPPHVSAALLWDGDWLGAQLDDALAGDISGFLPAYSPWPEVDSVRTTTYVEVGVNANRLAGLGVEATPTSVYLTAVTPEAASPTICPRSTRSPTVLSTPSIPRGRSRSGCAMLASRARSANCTAPVNPTRSGHGSAASWCSRWYS